MDIVDAEIIGAAVGNVLGAGLVLVLSAHYARKDRAELEQRLLREYGPQAVIAFRQSLEKHKNK